MNNNQDFNNFKRPAGQNKGGIRPTNGQNSTRPASGRPNPSGARPANGRNGARPANGRPNQNGAYTPNGKPSPRGARPTNARTNSADAKRRLDDAKRQAQIQRDAEKRRAALEKRKKRAQTRARTGRSMRRLFVIFAIVLLVVLAVAGIVYRAIFYTNPSDSHGKTDYVIFDKKLKGVSSDVAYYGGTAYVNFEYVAEDMKLSRTGDSLTVKFITVDPETENYTGESITFRDGSVTVALNWQNITLTSPCRIIGGETWVPLSFITDYMSGIDVKIEKDGAKITLSHIEVEDETDDKGEAVTEPSEFALSLAEPVDTAVLPEGAAASAAPSSSSATTPTFSTDLSAYEQYMNPTDRDAYLMLVNKTTTLSSDYVPQNLTGIANTRDDGRSVQKMQLYAAKALDAMFTEMKAAGYSDVSVTSAYRSYEYQSSLYSNYVSREMSGGLSREAAEAEADKYSARAGTSEHQSGLCADLHNLSEADVAFANKLAYKWLCDNAWKFGFILRFPENKTDITGYNFEPWHYRYVGRYHAEKIHESGMCLEEYLITLN